MGDHEVRAQVTDRVCIWDRTLGIMQESTIANSKGEPESAMASAKGEPESAMASAKREPESTMASAKGEPENSMVVGTDPDKGGDIRQPSINIEPRTLNQMAMERAMAAALKIYAEDPSEDFTKDAIDTATRENAPAKDAGDANALKRHLDDLIQKAGNVVEANFMQSKSIETPAAPPPTPSTLTLHRPDWAPN